MGKRLGEMIWQYRNNLEVPEVNNGQREVEEEEKEEERWGKEEIKREGL
jgi:hypothetical protein